MSEKNKEDIYDFTPYLSAKNEDVELFENAGLYEILFTYYRILFPEEVSKNENLNISLVYSKDDLCHINSYIKYALELIGKYSNKRFGDNALLQDRFFKRKLEREVFFRYLFLAIQGCKMEVIAKHKQGIKGIGVMNNGHLEIESLSEKDYEYFIIDGEDVKEKDIYAACVFYVVNFLVDAIKEDDIYHFSRIIAGMSHFAHGSNYKSVHGKKGSEKRNKKHNKTKEQIYQLFVKNDVYNKMGPKHEAMLASLIPLLKKHKIKHSEGTLRTRWLKEFITRYNEEGIDIIK